MESEKNGVREKWSQRKMESEKNGVSFIFLSSFLKINF